MARPNGPSPDEFDVTAFGRTLGRGRSRSVAPSSPPTPPLARMARGHPGQLQALLREDRWRSLTDAERAIAIAANKCGRGAASSHATPFDQREKELCYRRRQESDRHMRRILQRCVLEVRAFRRHWKCERALQEATRAGRNLAKERRQSGLVLRSRQSASGRCEEFREHWTEIVQGAGSADTRLLEELRVESSRSFPDKGLCSVLSFLDIVRKPKKGRVGGEDGVISEFLEPLSAGQTYRLYQLLVDVLEGTAPVPARWKQACVSLIPRVSGASIPGQFRLITVLAVPLKIAMRLWAEAARPFLALHARSSHGFRPTFHCAEVHLTLRCVLERRREWGHSSFLAKLGISKAYDIVGWSAISRVFAERHLPEWLRSAYWRRHLDRQLGFRTADGTIAFRTVALRGMPQGSPECPMLYTAIIEDAICRTEARLSVNESPAGIRLHPREQSAEQVEACGRRPRCGAHHMVYANFSDDTYVIGSTPSDLVFAVSVLSVEFAGIGQHLHPGKCEVWAPADTNPSIFLWTLEQIRVYIESDVAPPLSAAATASMKCVAELLVLGTMISLDPAQEGALSHRIQAAWKAWHATRPQLRQRSGMGHMLLGAREPQPHRNIAAPPRWSTTEDDRRPDSGSTPSG